MLILLWSTFHTGTPKNLETDRPTILVPFFCPQHAVGNTIKRVVIIVASCIVFRNPMTPLAVAGSAIAVLGTLLYSLMKARYASK